MKKRVRILISLVVLMSLLIVSCSKNESGNSSGSEGEFFKLVDSDKENDKKSVYWDGSKASIVEDKMDDKSIIDGRFGLRMMPDEIKNEAWTIRIDTYKSEYDIVSSNVNNFVVETSDNEDLKLYCSIEKLDKSYDEACTELDSDNDWRKTSLKYKIMGSSYGVDDFTLYLGVDRGEGKAGHTCIIKGINGDAYKIKFIGIGKLNDILGLSANTLGTFDMIINEE